MLRPRIIPCLMMSEGRLIKTKKFKNPTYIGDPINAIKIFNEKEADELILIDIGVGKIGQEPDYELIEKCASECFMPMTYGGGIKTMHQADKIFSLGVEKIALQGALFGRPDFLSELVARYGSQSIVVSIDVKTNWYGGHGIHAKNSKIRSDLISFLRQIELMGAGEILLTSVNNDGKMSGMDLKLISRASHTLRIPLVACGGVNSIKDIRDGLFAGASGIGVGSMFVFYGPHNAVLINYPSPDVISKILK